MKGRKKRAASKFALPGLLLFVGFCPVTLKTRMVFEMFVLVYSTQYLVSTGWARFHRTETEMEFFEI